MYLVLNGSTALLCHSYGSVLRCQGGEGPAPCQLFGVAGVAGVETSIVVPGAELLIVGFSLRYQSRDDHSQEVEILLDCQGTTRASWEQILPSGLSQSTGSVCTFGDQHPRLSTIANVSRGGEIIILTASR
jgi:hypothetical protein